MLKLTKVAKNIDEVDATSLLLELVAEPTKFFRRKSKCFITEPAKPSYAVSSARKRVQLK